MNVEATQLKMIYASKLASASADFINDSYKEAIAKVPNGAIVVSIVPFVGAYFSDYISIQYIYYLQQGKQRPLPVQEVKH